MWAHVVDRRELSVNVEYCDNPVVDLEASALPCRDLIDFGDRLELRHYCLITRILLVVETALIIF